VVQDRKQQEELVLAVDPANGKTKPLLSEKDDAWIKIDQDFPHWLEDGSGFLWITERAGGPAVELRKADGSDPRILVPPSCGFRGLIHIDEQRHRLYFQASTDPSQIHLHYVSLKGGGSTALTGETDKLDDQGEHSALFAPKGDVYVHVHASPRNPVTALLRSEAGGIVGELPSIARKAPFVPHVEFVKVGEGEGIYCSVTRPRKFDSAKKYPVIVDVYGGPGHLEVRQVLSNYILPQIYADQGFIVVAIDNRGTPGRGRAWERAIRGNFAKHTLEDQVAGLQALGKQFPEIDLNRVGIVGWSFGGYMSALAVLRRPDLFKAAVAGAPVVDWQDYDTHYTERYLGLPKENKKGYEESNLLTYAKDLKQPLLLVHGTGDDNVFFLHTLKLSNALFRQGKDHEVLPLSGLSHMVRDPLVRRRLEERIIRFFQKHL
jgi:dipeptidyl-peptidase-4